MLFGYISQLLGLRLLPDRLWVEETDRMAAAIAKCETIIEHYKGAGESTRLVVIDGELTKGEAAADKSFKRFMTTEPLFERYLKEAGNDATLALALARSEVARLEKLRSLGWSSRPELIGRVGKVLLLPITLISVTALLGSCVGTFLQERSFQRTRAFDLRLTTLRKEQEEAAAWFIKVRDLYKQIESDEQSYIKSIRIIEREKDQPGVSSDDRLTYQRQLDDYAKNSWLGDITKLQDAEKDLTRMGQLSAGIDNRQLINGAAAHADKVIGTFITCLKKDRWDWNQPCATNTSMKPYEEFVASYSVALESLLNER